MALSKAHEDLLALITDDADRAVLRAQLEKHAPLRERYEGYLRQSDYDRYMNENKAQLESGKNALAKIDTWQKWYNDNKDVPDQLNAKITELSALRTQAEKDVEALRQQLAARGDDVDKAAVMAEVEQRLAQIKNPTKEDVARIAAEEAQKLVTAGVATATKEFYEKAVPELTFLNARTVAASLEHFKNFQDMIPEEGFAAISKIMTEQKETDPVKAYHQWIAPKMEERAKAARDAEIKAEVDKQVAAKLAAQGGVPGSGAAPPVGPVMTYIGTKAPGDLSTELPPNASMKDAAARAAAELRAEGKALPVV